MPNSLMEAMALGLPVIATDCPSGGPRQLIQNGVNGILVENDNPEELASAILYLLRNENVADKLGSKAKLISSEFGTENICKRWEEYIAKILKENSDVFKIV
jgi:glycosyltransferase involved in cell wall biosynthesis